MANINIDTEIYKNISKINYKESKRIQLYTFPSITRNQNVIMINDSQSGKTMAYLPILMSFIMEKEERYCKLNKMGGGPIVVILCSNSKKCEEIYDLTWLIWGKQNRRISLVTYPRYGNIVSRKKILKISIFNWIVSEQHRRDYHNAHDSIKFNIY